MGFFQTKPAESAISTGSLENLLQGYSIEVLPRTAAKIPDFRELLPASTRIYIAHIDGTPIEDMVNTAKRLSAEGFQVMPHFPARSIPDRGTLKDWISRYQGEADIKQALVLAGGISQARGDFSSSIELLETEEFGQAGFTHLHVAGHPEGNKDIDPNGGTAGVDAALRWKKSFSETSDAKMALVTQFVFETDPIVNWVNRLKDIEADLPVYVGVAGPAKLQTMIKFAIECGVGSSIKVLQRRAKDLTKLLLPFEPGEVLGSLADAKESGIELAGIHIFPLGGIKTAATWLQNHGGQSTLPAKPAA